MKLRAKISGFDHLDRKLTKLAKSLPTKIQKNILSEAGEIIADDARVLVPVDSGDLKGSIVVSDQRLGGAFKMDGGLSGAGVQIFIGPSKGGTPDGFHAHFVEFGTVHMSAQPFMRPAFDNTKGQVRSRIVANVRREILKAARRG